jgi:hypothetical protein
MRTFHLVIFAWMLALTYISVRFPHPYFQDDQANANTTLFVASAN